MLLTNISIFTYLLFDTFWHHCFFVQWCKVVTPPLARIQNFEVAADKSDATKHKRIRIKINKTNSNGRNELKGPLPIF